MGNELILNDTNAKENMEELQGDFYEILGVSNNASFDEISNAYRNRAKEFHPDLNDGNEIASINMKKLMKLMIFFQMHLQDFDMINLDQHMK